jgi:hypothetical protein
MEAFRGPYAPPNESEAKMKTRTYERAFVLCLALFCLFASAAVIAQDNKSDLRTVHGTVVDNGDNPAANSTVYLLNSKTQAVKTYFTDEKGAYHFSGLDPNVDYEIHAEKGNMTTATRKISSYDSRRDMDMTLKLAHDKGNG